MLSACGRAQGSLVNGTFGAWSPVANEMEICDVGNAADLDDEEEEEEDEEPAAVLEGEAEGGGEPAVGEGGRNAAMIDEVLEGMLM